MPFDSTATEPFTFQDRRDRACALWARVPPQVFDMQNWECGSSACALGWLGIEKHDGWRMSVFIPEWTGGSPGRSGMFHAAEYFGLTYAEAIACFGGDLATARFHRRWHASWIKPADVARTLQALPVWFRPLPEPATTIRSAHHAL